MLFVVFRSDRMSALELSDYIDRYIVDRFKNINGVADVQIYGERRYAMRIWVDRERLAAYELTVQDVEDALRAQNVEIPSGRIESVDREFTVLSRTGLTSVDQFDQIVVKRARTARRCICAMSPGWNSAPPTSAGPAASMAGRRSSSGDQAGGGQPAGRFRRRPRHPAGGE